MRAAFTLNLRRYPSDHVLHDELRDLGFADGGFIPPRFGFNRQQGRNDYNKLFNEATRLNALCQPWVPLVIDYERAYRWIRSPDHPSVPVAKEVAYDLIRYASVFVRQSFASRLLADWARPASWTNPYSDRLGCAFTCACPITNRKSSWDDDHWWAVRNQEYDEALTWRMPINLWVTNFSWQPARALTDAEWDLTLQFILAREPDYILYSGAGDPTYIKKRATELYMALANAPEF